MIYQCIKPWTTPKRNQTGQRQKELRDISRFSYWECEPKRDRLNDEFLLRRINSITKKLSQPVDFATIPLPLFYHCLEPVDWNSNKLWECTKDIVLEQYKENETVTDDTITVYKGSLWKMDTSGSTYLSADIHLDDPYGEEWIEVSIETFHQHFKPHIK